MGNSISEEWATAYLKKNLIQKDMKNKKMTSTIMASLLMLMGCFIPVNSFAQTTNKAVEMKDGKMMVITDGKTMPMTTEMTMNNGTKFMKNGEFITKDGKKMKMKEGDKMDMSGNLTHGDMMNQGDMMNNDYYMMKNGKMMMVMKDGNEMPMTKDMTMKNGTKFMMSGEYIMKDGKKMKMKEGDKINMNGNISHGEKMMEGKK